MSRSVVSMPPTLCALFALAGMACATQPSDTSETITPSRYGGKPLRAVVDPNAPGHASLVNKIVTVTGTQVVAIDSFDETEDGKARGTIYIQELGSVKPYSGISLYSPSFSPADTRPVVGDIFDWSGIYREADRIGTAVFRMEGEVQPLLIQLEKPTGRPRFDGGTPFAVEINAADLTSYETGRPWLGMLVRLKDVQVTKEPTGTTGRQSAFLNASGDKNLPTVTVANELMALSVDDFKANTRFSSIVGVVTFAFGIHFAPRSKSDLEFDANAQAQ